MADLIIPHVRADFRDRPVCVGDKVFGSVKAVFVQVFDGREAGIFPEQGSAQVFADDGAVGNLSDIQRIRIIVVNVA